MDSKMAAATRVAQVVKSHTPLIKFPERTNIPKPRMQESFESRVPPLHPSASQKSIGQPLSYQNIPSISRIQDTPDTSELLRTLPTTYWRKTMSVEEMEYIQCGGPE
ncbi:alpha-ketoglutarate dehydrogenase component 4-like [Heteronotia binoei]|uniref:alpha-ketoglutarate dehydrogenase component 4-like n=1 Tax=Heteronotia binoei TaxID=13085 RepID=UPI002931AA75|nr:alpha-ketoglutarate dehydrogenase component 4-like [Heteronotia binoei]